MSPILVGLPIRLARISTRLLPGLAWPSNFPFFTGRVSGTVPPSPISVTSPSSSGLPSRLTVPLTDTTFSLEPLPEQPLGQDTTHRTHPSNNQRAMRNS